MGIEFDETPKALKERKSPSGGGGMNSPRYEEQHS